MYFPVAYFILIQLYCLQASVTWNLPGSLVHLKYICLVFGIFKLLAGAGSLISTTVYCFVNFSFLFIHHSSPAIILGFFLVILKPGIFRLLSSSSFCHLISSLVRASSVLFIKSSKSITVCSSKPLLVVIICKIKVKPTY